MFHELVEKISSLKVGSMIKLKASTNPMEVLGIDEETITGKHFDGVPPADSSGADPRAVITVPHDRYEASLVLTPDFDECPVKSQLDWVMCEKHYGINHYGSYDKSPVRALALRVLKGDEEAIAKVKKALHK